MWSVLLRAGAGADYSDCLGKVNTKYAETVIFSRRTFSFHDTVSGPTDSKWTQISVMWSGCERCTIACRLCCT